MRNFWKVTIIFFSIILLVFSLLWYSNTNQFVIFQEEDIKFSIENNTINISYFLININEGNEVKIIHTFKNNLFCNKSIQLNESNSVLTINNTKYLEKFFGNIVLICDNKADKEIFYRITFLGLPEKSLLINDLINDTITFKKKYEEK